MTDDHGRPDDQGKAGQDGMRQVFEGGHGYYLEPTPGAGPAHHDDVPASVGDAERKQALPHDLARMGDDDGTCAYLVLMPSGSITATLPPGRANWGEAYRRAQVVGGLVVGLPILADLRSSYGGPDDPRHGG